MTANNENMQNSNSDGASVPNTAYSMPIYAPVGEESNTVPDPKTVYSIPEKIFAPLFTFAGFFIFKALFEYQGITLGIFMLALSAVSMIFAIISKARQNAESILLFIDTVIFSANLIITSNGLIIFLDFVFAAVLYALWAYSLNSDGERTFDDYSVFRILYSFFYRSFANIGKCPSAAMSLISKTSGKNVSKVLAGLLISLPVTIIVFILLTSADTNFEQLISKITDGFFTDLFQNILTYIFMLPLSFLIFGMIYGGIRSEKRLSAESCASFSASVKIAPSLVVYSSVIPLCALYVLFFFSQLSYFISAFSSVLPEEFSAAEYARRGFFELCAVAVINLSVIAAINLFCKDTESGKRPAVLKFFTVLLSVFTLILLVTAFSKMAMYISRFGLTRLRAYTSWFMILLALILVLIIVRQAVKINLSSFTAAIFTVMMIFLSFAQCDALIAGYNIRSHESGKTEFDKYYFVNSLSEDAVYVIPYMLESGDQVLADAAKEFLKENSHISESKINYTISESIVNRLAFENGCLYPAEQPQA